MIFLRQLKMAFFICLMVFCFFSAQGKSPTSLLKIETYQDIIEKAYALSLQKDRAQALTLLNNSLRIESRRNPKATKELARAYEKIATAFFSDKAQQLFELGISLRLSDAQLSFSKTNEAFKIEPENILIQWSILRMQIQNGDCGSALSQGQKIMETSPDFEETRLVTSQAAVCAGQFDQYQRSKGTWDQKRTSRQRHWKMLEIEYLYKTADFAQGLSLAQAQQKEDLSFPESYYWSWKLSRELKAPADVDAAKYLSLCKSLSVRQVRDFMLEPLLCRRALEVETFLKKSNTANL